ncbi:MipA/OmpV family protein [Oleisolibacter albus]|uniref:MipA/OmpV family protein n=1 Tax=Oleisolibacter albus TaxID=2171757 RepID=UPI000DF321CF|nr:MipA/OmpV family protein [Oleisolibacter albus]
MSRALAAALIGVLLVPAAAQAQSSMVLAQQPDGGSKPLWEAGLFVGAAYLPDYPAASQGQFRALPLPYVIYRGDILKIGDGGLIRAEKSLSDRLDFDIGLSGSFDSDSNDNDARRGMPNLDLLLEAGPAVTYHLRDKRDPLQIDLSLEVRAVISAEFVSFGYEGIAVNPKIIFNYANVADSGTTLYLSIGPTWGYDGMNEYFYDVAPAYATPDRPAYKADEGYVGTRVNIGAAYPLTERVRVFAGTQIGYFGGSSNEDSPLFRDRWTVGVGAGLTWSFWQSEARVQNRD